MNSTQRLCRNGRDRTPKSRPGRKTCSFSFSGADRFLWLRAWDLTPRLVWFFGASYLCAIYACSCSRSFCYSHFYSHSHSYIHQRRSFQLLLLCTSEVCRSDTAASWHSACRKPYRLVPRRVYRHSPSHSCSYSTRSPSSTFFESCVV